MSFTNQLSVGLECQPNPFGIWMIDFSSPVANCGAPFTAHTAWCRWSTSTRGTLPLV